MLKTRVITAVCLVAFLIALLAWGGPQGWASFVVVVLTLGLWEWTRLARVPAGAQWPAALIGGVGLTLGALFLDIQTLAPVLMGIACLFWLLVVPFILKNPTAPWLSKLWPHPPIALVVLSGAGVSLMAAYHRGVVFLFSLLALVWIADIFAYFGGKAMGKRKLAPTISPGKSWEGAYTGMIGVVAYGWAWTALAKAFPSLGTGWPVALLERWHPVGFTFWLLALGGLSITGDLFESLMKRRAGMKDSSQILPGHGGILDRIDAQLPVLPLAMLVLGASA